MSNLLNTGEKIRIAGTINDSIVDGPGLRFTVFTQGCDNNCPGCHNPHTHDKNGGELIEIDEILKTIDKNPLLDGVTISGGEPFLQAEQLVPLAKMIKERDLSLMVYTGYIYENLIAEEKYSGLLQYVDILVDGPYIESQKSLDSGFTGSKNQRVIELTK